MIDARGAGRRRNRPFLIIIMAVLSATLSTGIFGTASAFEFDTYSKRSDYLKFLGHTLPSNNIQCISADPEDKNSIFIGTDAGLCKFNGKSFRIYGVDSGLYKEGPIDGHINCVISTTNEVWVGTDAGLSKYNKLTSKWSHYEKNSICPIPTNYVQCMYYIEPLLIIGTWGEGIVIYDTKSGKWKPYAQKNGLEARYISSMAYDNVRNVLWVGTYDRGFYSFSEDRFVEISAKNSDLVSDRINAVAVSGGKVYLGTPLGLSVYDGKSFKNYSKKSGFNTNVILSIKVDGFDVYIGTDAGLYKIYNDVITHYPISNNLSNGKQARIVCIEAAGSKLYAGTQHYGLIEIKK